MTQFTSGEQMELDPEKEETASQGLSILKASEALKSMSEHELLTVRKYAELLAGRADLKARGVNDHELLNEAIVRILDGTRKWYDTDNLSFSKFLMGVIKSIVSHLSNSSRVKFEVPIAQDNSEVLLDFSSYKTTPEDQLIAREELKRIEAQFDGDEIALLLLAARAEGYKLKDIPELISVSQSEVEAAYKRVRRKLIEPKKTEKNYDY